MKLKFKTVARLSPIGIAFLISAQPAMAASDFIASLENLVNVVVSRILPILAFFYLGLNIFHHVQGDPNAKTESQRVVMAIVTLLCLNGVWALIQRQIR